MRDLNYELHLLTKRNKDGSLSTRANRSRILSLLANQLFELGFRQMKAHELASRHIKSLLNEWQREGIAVGTIKNRMAVLRWWAEKVNRASVINRTNAEYGIPDRELIPTSSKAKTLTEEDLAKIDSPEVAFSLRLQQQFGLRREESIKFMPGYADRGDHIALKASWCKGGRARELPIVTQAQRQLLDELHQHCGKGSLIPRGSMYITQQRLCDRQSLKAGLRKNHGLRHAYAQALYQDLTGWPCQAAGGVHWRELTAEQRVRDLEARAIISRELGHERIAVVATYLNLAQAKSAAEPAAVADAGDAFELKAEAAAPRTASDEAFGGG